MCLNSRLGPGGEEPFDSLVSKPFDRHAHECNLYGYRLEPARSGGSGVPELRSMDRRLAGCIPQAWRGGKFPPTGLRVPLAPLPRFGSSTARNAHHDTLALWNQSFTLVAPPQRCTLWTGGNPLWSLSEFGFVPHPAWSSHIGPFPGNRRTLASFRLTASRAPSTSLPSMPAAVSI